MKLLLLPGMDGTGTLFKPLQDALQSENAGWIENHLGIPQRIGREHWREQARELALATAGTKKAAGQQ